MRPLKIQSNDDLVALLTPVERHAAAPQGRVRSSTDHLDPRERLTTNSDEERPSRRRPGPWGAQPRGRGTYFLPQTCSTKFCSLSLFSDINNILAARLDRRRCPGPRVGGVLPRVGVVGCNLAAEKPSVVARVPSGRPPPAVQPEGRLPKALTHHSSVA